MDNFRSQYNVLRQQNLKSGSLYLGTNNQGQTVCIKEIDLTKHESYGEACKLKFTLSKLLGIRNSNLQHIIRIFDEGDKLILIMEQIEEAETLQKYLEKNKPLSQQQVQSIIYQIKNAYEDLYNKNIMHRNIHPDNILIRADQNKNKLQIFLTGHLRMLYLPNIQQSFKGAQVGSPLWIAPEIFEDRNYGCQADIFSLGLLYFSLIYNIHPVEYVIGSMNKEQDIVKFFKKISQTPLKCPPTNKRNDLIHQSILGFIESMLQSSTQQRLSWVKFFNDFKEFSNFSNQQQQWKNKMIEPSSTTKQINNQIYQPSQYNQNLLLIPGQQNIQWQNQFPSQLPIINSQQHQVNQGFNPILQSQEYQQNQNHAHIQVISDSYTGIYSQTWENIIHKLIQDLMACVEFIQESIDLIKEYKQLIVINEETKFYLLASMQGFVYSATLNIYGLKNNQPQLICQYITLVLGLDIPQRLAHLQQYYSQNYAINAFLQKFSQKAFKDLQEYVTNIKLYNFEGVESLQYLLLNSNTNDFEVFLNFQKHIFETFIRANFQYIRLNFEEFHQMRFIYIFLKSCNFVDYFQLKNYRNFSRELLFSYKNQNLTYFQNEVQNLQYQVLRNYY